MTVEKFTELIQLARQMCFTEKALMGRVAVAVRQTLNGQELIG